MRTRLLLFAASVSIFVSFFRAPSQIVEPALRKLNMICGVHGSPGNSVTEPTWSKRKPVGAALACVGGFFICAQPARPAKAVPAMNKVIKSFFIAKNTKPLFHAAGYPLFALLRMEPVQHAMDKGRK